jgi:hypothetical protein
MMAEQGIKIVEKDGAFHLSGVLNEYADFSSLLGQREPLRLNMKAVSRLNSIGIRNLLKFLSDWGPRAFTYEECPSEFIDQVNMIPALLGSKNNGKIESLFVPYECPACDHEDEVLSKVSDFAHVPAGGEGPSRTCAKCGGKMTILTDSFFIFLMR